MVQIIISFIAGILTIAAPCILLPLPIILGGSVGQNSKARPLWITVGFILSFAGIALLANFLFQNLNVNPNILRTSAIVLLGIFAVFMIWPTPFEKLMTHTSSLINRAGRAGRAAGNGNFGGFILGLVIGIIWAPCAGPILGSILTLIALQKDTAQASLMLISYAFGAGLPMLVIAYGGQILTTKIRVIAKYSKKLQQIFGILLVFLAIAIYFQYDTVIQAKLVENFPSLTAKVETNLINSLNNSENPSQHSQNIIPLNEPVNLVPLKGKIEFKNYGPAPELTGIYKWLNSDPLTIESLKGKVILVDFWTYTCINCIRTLPYVTKWYDTYKDKGLIVIGVHTPEFAFEKETGNVTIGISRNNINYPVAQDNDYATWNAFKNQFWPAKYLIDKDGNIVYTHFGEGEYDHTENAIRQLLGLEGEVREENGRNLSKVKSPEMYFGLTRLENFTTEGVRPINKLQTYRFPGELQENTFALEGQWKFNSDSASLEKDGGKVKLHFNSGKVHMVAKSLIPQTLKITVDAKIKKDVFITESELYTIFDSEDYNNHVLEIEIPKSGFEAFTFTFG